jgi:signal transduction histidine kinase
LLAVARTLQLPEDDAPPLRLVVAGDKALLAEPLQRFTRMLLIALGLLALGLALAVAVQLHLALRPLKLLRARLAAVRSGVAAQLEGSFPQELQPLVNEFNHVLQENAAMVQRARTQAGNLAHAVHTPLTILANAAAQEHSPLALLVQDQVTSARRQVDYHLARARAAAAVRATGLHTPVLAPLRALLRTMQRLHAGRALSFEIAPQAQDGAFRGEEQDLYELLGNLIDNAGKSAHQRVVVDVQCVAGQLCFTVDDDGPGIPEHERERMFARGAQLDEQRTGSGLGLDIVRTLAETYGGSVQALPSPLGGARMRLCLPMVSET